MCEKYCPILLILSIECDKKTKIGILTILIKNEQCDPFQSHPRFSWHSHQYLPCQLHCRAWHASPGGI